MHKPECGGREREKPRDFMESSSSSYYRADKKMQHTRPRGKRKNELQALRSINKCANRLKEIRKENA